MRKRRSFKYQERVRKSLAGKRDPVTPIPSYVSYLSMTDVEIDRAHWNYAKVERTRMKKLAEKERLRLQVQEILRSESDATN